MEPVDPRHDPDAAMTADGKCGATNRQGNPCGRPAGWGTTHAGTGHCKMHGGSTPNGKKHAARLEVASLRDAMGYDTDISADDALLEMVKVQYGMVAWIRGQVSDLENDNTTGPVGGSEHGHPRWEPHVLIRMRGEEEDRLLKLIKTCHDIGIDERRVQVMEQYGEQLAAFARGLLEDFGLMDDPRAPGVVRRRMLELGNGGTEGQVAA